MTDPDRAAIKACLEAAIAKLDDAWQLLLAAPSPVVPMPLALNALRTIETLSNSLDAPTFDEQLRRLRTAETLVKCKCCRAGMLSSAEMDMWHRVEVKDGG